MDYERLTAAELDVAAPLGLMPNPFEEQPRDTLPSTRAAMEQVVHEAVVNGPCYVLFSGGRDSSLVLALATHAARRAAVPDPIPVTAVYPADAHADESEWQHLVLSHLGLTNRIVISVGDERTTLGDLATRHLRRRGLVWPEAVHTQPLFFEQLDPGTLLTGEGGDAFIEGRRITPLVLLRQTRRLPSVALLRAAAAELRPTVAVRRQVRRSFADPEILPWLRPAARDVLASDTTALRGPLRWDRATWALYRQRGTWVGLHNPVVSAAEYGLVMRHPIAEPAVIAALAAEGGVWGFRGRTNLFRRLAGDLLPDAILSRRSKAAFNASRWGERERAFAELFSGGVFSPEFIDEERLREVWLSDRPHPVSFFLAQIAWLHDEGLPLVPGTGTEPHPAAKAQPSGDSRPESPSLSSRRPPSESGNGGPHGSLAT